MKGAALIAAPVAGLLALMLGVVVMLGSSQSASGLPTCVPLPKIPSGDIGLDREQRFVAATVVSVGKELKVPSRGWVVALAAGMQESGLRALPYGDRDSLGVFQQRTGWGPVDERMDPRTAAVMFYTGGHAGQPGLLDIRGWAGMSVTRAAQAVQVSAFPDAYAKWEPVAVRLVEDLAGVDAGCQEAGTWVFPLGHAQYVATAGFGDCGAHWAHCHTGQDFAAPTGTPVLAAGDGVVTFAGWDGPYGNAVHVLHADGTSTWYAHLSRLATHTRLSVKAGQLIGLVGSTGNTTGPHLHFEVRTASTATTDGTPIDPLRWLRTHRIH